jgi:hypothetical protein
MHTLLLSLVALGGVTGHVDTTSTSFQTIAATSECTDGSCTSCRNGHHAAKDPKCTIFGPMPQTCYAPRYGCYPGNERYTNRYPAFHGTHSRKAYNYRNYFDYPWHAEPHEPTSLFSYETESDGTPLQKHGTHPEVPAPTLPTAQQQRSAPSVVGVAKVRPASTTFSAPASEQKSLRNLRR